MDLAVPRNIVRLQYAAARLPFTLLNERVVARYWDQDAPVRVGFERWLGSLDLIAGRLLDDDEISRQGLALMRLTEDPAQAGGSAMEPPAEPAGFGQVAPDLPVYDHVPEAIPADDRTPETPTQTAAYHEQDDPQRTHRAVDGQASTGDAPTTAGEEPISDAAGAAGQPGTPDTPAAEAGAVDVTFTLPADVHADTVALCGEFNDWSAENARLERGSDGSWRVTVALEPGRSYRYRYLLDGHRWENDRQADRYVPNALGSIDSVVVVK